MPSVDPEALRTEAKKWDDLATEMSTIRQHTANLWLGFTAFFPGGMTESLHHTKYQEYLGEIVSRLQGGAIEYELIGITLRNIAAAYEASDEVNAQSFRVTAQELEHATDEHSPQPPPPSGPNRFE